jgi:hypothetical protein
VQRIFFTGANYTSNCVFTVTDAGAPFGICGEVLSNSDITLKSICKNKATELSWFLADETAQINNPYLEYSIDGERYQVLKRLDAITESNRLYRFEHSADRYAHYRIRYTDGNGFTNYSDVVQSKCKSGNTFSVYPNPAKNLVNINITYLNRGANAELLIYNILGEIVYKTDVSSAQNVLVNSEYFSQGIYYVVLNSEQDTQMQKLVISN